MSGVDRKELVKKLDVHYQAFDVYKETGLTPRQLADQRNELLEFAKTFVGWREYSEHGEFPFEQLEDEALRAIANAEKQP